MEGDSGFAWPLSNHSPGEPRGSFGFAKGQQMLSTNSPSTLECLLDEVYRADTRWESSPGQFSGGETPPVFPPSSGQLPAPVSGWPESFPAPEAPSFEGFPPSTLPREIPPWTSSPFPGQGGLDTAITRAFPGQPIVINHYHYHNAQSFDPGPPPGHFPSQRQAVGGQSPPLQSSPPGYSPPVSDNPSPRFYGSFPSDGYLTSAINRAERNLNPGHAPTRSTAFAVSHSKPLTLGPGIAAAGLPGTPINHPGLPTDRPLTQVLSQPQPDLSEPVVGAHKRPGIAEGEPETKRVRARSAPPSWFELPGEGESPADHLNQFQDVPYGKRPAQTAALRELENSWLGQFANPIINPFENPVDIGSPVDAAITRTASQPIPNPVPMSRGKEAKERSVAAPRAPRLSGFLQGALNRFVADTSGDQGDHGRGGRQQ